MKSMKAPSAPVCTTGGANKCTKTSLKRWSRQPLRKYITTVLPHTVAPFNVEQQQLCPLTQNYSSYLNIRVADMQFCSFWYDWREERSLPAIPVFCDVMRDVI